MLPRKKIPQFWGLGVHRNKHKSTTKRPFTEMEGNTKESLKKMILYMKQECALQIDPHTNELKGVRVIPGRH